MTLSINGKTYEAGELIAYHKRLEKENAELRLKLEALDGQTPWKDIKDKSELIKRNAELENELKKWKDGIVLKDEEIGCIETEFNTFKSKAKELLKRCYDSYIYLEPLRSEIEQFLKENE